MRIFLKTALIIIHEGLWPPDGCASLHCGDNRWKCRKILTHPETVRNSHIEMDHKKPQK